jgi:hypothetical protein
VEFLAARHQAWIERDLSARAQVASDSPEVMVGELPILIDRSEAVDLSATMAGRNLWFERQFRRYYGIGDETFLPVLPMSEEYRALEFDSFNGLDAKVEEWQSRQD